MDQTGLGFAFCLGLFIAGIISIHHHGGSGSPSCFLSASLSSILLIPLLIILSSVPFLSFLTHSAAGEPFPVIWLTSQLSVKITPRPLCDSVKWKIFHSDPTSPLVSVPSLLPHLSAFSSLFPEEKFALVL